LHAHFNKQKSENEFETLTYRNEGKNAASKFIFPRFDLLLYLFQNVIYFNASWSTLNVKYIAEQIQRLLFKKMAVLRLYQSGNILTSFSIKYVNNVLRGREKVFSIAQFNER